jgi:hypothetical protein
MQRKNNSKLIKFLTSFNIKYFINLSEILTNKPNKLNYKIIYLNYKNDYLTI